MGPGPSPGPGGKRWRFKPAGEDEHPPDFPEVQVVNDVLMWRFDQLSRAGYPPALAVWLAADSGVDLHVAVDLLGAGCPPWQAADILM